MEKYTFKVSDETLNSHGLKVLTNGIDTTNFEKNPIMLYMHDRDNLVIGRWENLLKKDNELFADAVFDENDDFALKIMNKVKGGFLKSASIGIIVKEKKDDTVTKCELMEISIVDIGSNKNALRMYSENEILTFSKNLKSDNMEELQQIKKALGLKEEASLEDVLSKIKDLKKKEKDLKNSNDKIATALVDEAIKRNLLDADKKNSFLTLFEVDFNNAKTTIESLIENSSVGTNAKGEFLNNFLSELGGVKSDEQQEKPKSQWTLNDYRKFAPKELKDNPKLYKHLLTKEYGEIQD